MSGFNPLAAILTQNKLTGTNYVDWKRNLDIVLTAEGYKYVLNTPCPDPPADDAPEGSNEAYTRWKKADEMARCYILASMSNVLQHQHQSFATAEDMIFNLSEMFGSQGHSGRQSAM